MNIHAAKTHLSRLVAAAAKGEPFIIAKAGKPLVKVVPLVEEVPRKIKPTGFLKGKIFVPDDIKARLPRILRTCLVCEAFA